MNGRNSHYGLAGAVGLALVDSLNALRQVIDATRGGSAEGLVSAAVDGLIQHQDFDACVVVIEGDRGGQRAPFSGLRSAARMPGFIDPILASEVIPAVVSEGLVFFEPKLGDRGPNLHGSLLAVPVGDGPRVIGAVIVWNPEGDVLMPWHQSLLEMLADVFVMTLKCLAVLEDNEPDGTGSDRALGYASSVGVDDPIPTRGLPGIDRLPDMDDRRSFERSLENIVAVPVSARRARFLLFVDIDRFRSVREYGGEMTAERMIRVFSDLLRREMGGEKLIGHLGADQFGVVIERRSPEQAVQLAEAFIEVVDSLRLSFSGQRFDVSVSIGVAEVSGGPGAGLAGLRGAMQACQAAQGQGGGMVLSYEDSLDRRRRSRSEGRLLNRLTRALKDDDLELYAQLIAPLEDPVDPPGAPKYMHEILLRMRDDQGDLVSAGAFLPVAERYGVSVKLDRWVIRHAFRQIAATRFADDADHRFTLNLSGHSIDNHGLLDFIVAQFRQSGLQPQRICFEITETAAITDIGAAIEFVEKLKKVGCEFALDDFGSGHSSFLYLRDLPIDYLKIDGELVREIDDDPVSLDFVRTIEGVAQLMGRRTIAEFVENEAIRDAIAEIGCDYAQGYLIGRPVPLADVLKELAD